jgi:hypothetical protein
MAFQFQQEHKKQEKQDIFQPRIIKLKLRETKENPTH